MPCFRQVVLSKLIYCKRESLAFVVMEWKCVQAGGCCAGAGYHLGSVAQIPATRHPPPATRHPPAPAPAPAHLQFVAQRAQHMVHACRAAGQAVQHRLPGPHRSGAEQRGFQQVGAASNSAAHQHWNLNGHRTDHGGQQLGDGRQGVKRAPAVVVDDDTGHAVLYRQKRVLSVCDAFEQPRQVGDRVPPDDVVLNGRLEQEVAKQGAPAGQQVLGQLHAATRQVDGLELGSVPVASAPSTAARTKQKVPPLSAQALQSQLPPQVPNARLITQQVQLKPQGAAIGVVQHPLGHILWRLDGLAAQHQGGALADAGHGGGQFAMRIRHLRVGHWRHKQRVCQRAPQHGGAGVSLRSAEAPGGRVGSAAMPARFPPGSFRRLRRHQKSPAPAGFARGARGV